MIRTCVEVVAVLAASAVVGGLWWRMRRRSWSVASRDEAMKRHIHLHYS